MKRTFNFNNKPSVLGVSTVAGPKESQGCIAEFYEVKLDDDMFGESSFEKAECKMLYTAVKNSIRNAKLNEQDVDALISGDLLNQIIASTFTARNFNFGYIGIYNACATFVESLILGSVMIDGGFFNHVCCSASSHFSSAERQYRYPLELGCTRPPQSQWTVTGAGACVLSKNGNGPKITGATVGRVIDFGVTDANNMGAAMAPGAADTLITHFKDMNSMPKDYDLIVTGDLGTLGSRVLKDLTL
jgi:stage V sporulation protein AD